MNQSLKSLQKQKSKEFDKNTNLFVGDGGWCCRTDNDEGYSIWPEQYHRLQSFLSQSIQSAYQLAIKDVEKLAIKTLCVPIKKEQFIENGFEKWKLKDSNTLGVEPCYECSNELNIREFLQQLQSLLKKL